VRAATASSWHDGRQWSLKRRISAEQELGFASGRNPVFMIAAPSAIGTAIEAGYAPDITAATLLQAASSDLENAVLVAENCAPDGDRGGADHHAGAGQPDFDGGADAGDPAPGPEREDAAPHGRRVSVSRAKAVLRRSARQCARRSPLREARASATFRSPWEGCAELVRQRS
jgi:hypothetical protein